MRRMFRGIGRKTARNDNPNRGYDDVLQRLTSDQEVAHSYETLLSSLHLLNSSRPLRSILVTSTQPEEGKTTVTINLALTMMLAGKRVLIVDADLRKPRIHRILELDDTRGFADLLAGNLSVQDVIQVIERTSGAPQPEYILSVITSGRVSPNSFNLLASPKVKAAIEHFTEMFDTVLLDSPPALSVSDSLLVAPVVDGVILVLNTGAVSEKDAERAKERLEQAGGHILGVAMNRFSEKLHGPSFHPYHSYYLSRNRSIDRSAL